MSKLVWENVFFSPFYFPSNIEDKVSPAVVKLGNSQCYRQITIYLFFKASYLGYGKPVILASKRDFCLVFFTNEFFLCRKMCHCFVVVGGKGRSGWITSEHACSTVVVYLKPPYFK